MLPIIEIPPVISHISSAFTPFFNKCQIKHFREYTTGLIVSENTTIDSMNRLFINGNDQSSLNKFLTRSDWNEADVNEKRLELLQQKKKTQYKPHGIIALDDSLLHKTGENIEGVEIFYDHSSGEYMLGHNIVTAHYIDDQTNYPVDYRLYHKKGGEWAERAGFKTKIELAMELIRYCIEMEIPVKIFEFDSWFLCREIAELLREHGKVFVCPVKKDRHVQWDGPYIRLEDIAPLIKESEFEKIKLGKATYLAYSRVVKISKIGKVRLAVSYELDDNDNKKHDAPKYFVTNMLDWDAKKVLKTYHKRWGIETFYRDAKQELGLEDYQVRKLNAIRRHWYLIFVAYSLLKLGAGQGGLGRWVNAKTIGQMCTNVIMDSICSFVKWIFEKADNGVRISEVMETLTLKIAKV